MSEYVRIRGTQFRKEGFKNVSFEHFKNAFEKKNPYKKIDPRNREKALKEDYEKLTGNKPGRRERKTKDSE